MRMLRSLIPGVMAVMILVIGLRALIPAGFMPDLNALGRGQIEMVVCTLNGPVKMLVDGTSPHEPGMPTSGNADTSCPFALMAPWAPMTLLDAATLLYILALVIRLGVTKRPPRIQRCRIYTPVAPRGPPVIHV